MKDNEILSIEQLKAVLDNLPIAIYVTAVDNWELIYVNSRAKELIGFQEKTEKHQYTTCFKAAGYDEPCPFCNMEKISRTKTYDREFCHPVNQRIYQMSGRIIDWGNRPAHIEYIQDITEQKQREKQTQSLKERLQATFSNVPCGLCVYRADGNRLSPLFHNPAFYEIMGYSEEHISSIENKTEYLGVHPEDVDFMKAEVQRIVRSNGLMQHTYRVWNDKKGKYNWIRLDGAVKPQADKTKLLYCVYSDVSEQKRLEKELTGTSEKMQDIINAIPGGVEIYKVSDIFETVYFSGGVPELTGYTSEEYEELIKTGAVEMSYADDRDMMIRSLKEAIKNHAVADFEFRRLHRDGHIVWIHVQAKQIGEEEGDPLLQCVFHNISDLKETQLELNHLINSIPGGIATYRVEGERFVPTFFSDGVAALSGNTREEFERLVQHDAMDIIYEQDRARVFEAAQTALMRGAVLDVSYRMRHKDGNLIWIHLNGQSMGTFSNNMGFYAVLTGISAETRMFQSIANETADGIYAIDKESYELLYVNESKGLFTKGKNCVGQKCYAALHGKDAPCEFCTLKTYGPDGIEHEIEVDGTNNHYTSRFKEADWNGIPAYIQYIRDVTEEVRVRKEKERLEIYFQTIVKNLPGGVAVVRYEKDGHMTPEYLSDGFAAMTGMSIEDAWKLYRKDATIGAHPDDLEGIKEQMAAYMSSGEDRCEMTYRLRKGTGGYIWVNAIFSMIQSEAGERWIYAVYHDMTKEHEEQVRIRQQYNDLIMQHYRAQGSNALIVGHCNITKNKILEIDDHTDSKLLETFGWVREEFFTGISTLIVDEKERQAFLDMYLNKPALAAFERNETEKILNCFVKLPKMASGRYVQFKVNMVATPDTGDITGILTVSDITEKTISDRILHQLSVTSYDYIIDLDLTKDAFSVVAFNKDAHCAPPAQGIHSERVASMARTAVVPKDKERYAKSLAPDEMRRNLRTGGSYTFSYSLIDEEGDIRTKNMTVSSIDLRLGRVCLVSTDITDSIREQQSLLNMIAYTFDLAGFIEISSGRFTMFTRQVVLENLPPYIVDDYNREIGGFTQLYGTDGDDNEVRDQFQISAMLQKLAEKPNGYDFVFPYHSEEKLRYKQINVLWGDVNHRTVCIVRADVTDMLTAERETKKSLEKALNAAEEANRAKSDFLSTMSHDIRTPMNAIMGMTTLATAHMENKDKVKECLQKISISSKHLLSLINDVLDMSKLDGSKLLLNHTCLSLSGLVEQISAIMGPQAKTAEVQLDVQVEECRHSYFFGDSLRLNQILLNILSNAVKFTPKGGQVEFKVREIAPMKNKEHVRYGFTISDTGNGMAKDFLPHVFEPFARSSSAARIEGTGLGLSITKGLVDLMEGEISVESEINRGSAFHVELEFEIAQPEISANMDEAELANFYSKEEAFVNRYFLVAEDNAINAEILCELLSMWGAKSLVKTDGVQAVESFKDAEPGTYDAILMDVQMPEMDGHEATRIIRAMDRPDAKTIPIIAMTANAFAEDIQKSLEEGMNAHVAKPIDIDVLKSVLEKVLGRKQKKH